MSIAEKFETIADAVYEKGRVDENEDFWGALQNYGKPANYAYAFYSATWTDEIFKPVYDFVVFGSANNMFQASKITSTQKAIDITANTLYNNTVYMFQYATSLKTITLLKLKDNGSNNLTGCFNGCESLTNITIEGAIGRNASFADCPLSLESMKNIILHLMDYSGTDSEGKYTLTFSDECWNALEESGVAPDGGTWKDYVIKLGWLVG